MERKRETGKDDRRAGVRDATGRERNERKMKGGNFSRLFFGVRRLGAAFVLNGLPSSGEKCAYQNDAAENLPWM